MAESQQTSETSSETDSPTGLGAGTIFYPDGSVAYSGPLLSGVTGDTTPSTAWYNNIPSPITIGWLKTRSVNKVSRASCSLLSMVEPEQAAKPLATNDWSIAWLRVGRMLRKQEPVVLALMRPFMLMMGNVFGDSVPERRFAKEDHPIQAFLLDRANKPLGKGIEIWTAGGQRNRFDADGAEDHIESNGELGVPVPEQIPTAGQQAAIATRQVSSRLAHPGIGWICSDAAEIDFAAANVNEEQVETGIESGASAGDS